MDWVDTPLLVYFALPGHPAHATTTAELRQGDWASTVFVLGELFYVLTRHYMVDPGQAAADVERAARLPILWRPAEAEDVVLAAGEQARYGIETADAVLLRLARSDRGTLVSTDRGLLAAAREEGVAARNPLPRALELTIARWEEERLPAKGTRRLLTGVERWLRSRDSALADELLVASASLSRPPA